jgi:4-alpha-glucanotransferase
MESSMHRTSGILLHPTSLPGPFGIGDLGPAAYRFVDFLAAAGQGLWQVLPLGPTGFGDSPYQCTSAFAGNPLLIAPEPLRDWGWIDEADLKHPKLPAERVDFGAVKTWKRSLLDRAYRGFLARAEPGDREDFERFKVRHGDWLDDFALYAAIKSEQGHRPWTDWPEPLALREPAALRDWAAGRREALERHRFVQYLFFRQWAGLRRYALGLGVHLVGDCPIFVAHDSSEVWTHRDWFQLDGQGHPSVVAGVPPDYFSATGQRWGNPLYRWSALAADGYLFWVNRLRHALELSELVRIDHFRGFAGYWEIPAEEATAVNGRWVPGPGMDLFRALAAALGDDLPLIAEDLGVITPDVEALRDALGLPGMAILQFGFEALSDGLGRSAHLPHHHREGLAVYTGTHDNDTLLGWWAGMAAEVRDPTLSYLGSDGSAIHWDLIRAALGSVAALAVCPMQDLLGLGPEACMNRPGRPHGNWTWRFSEGAIEDGLPERLRRLSRLNGRLPYPPVGGPGAE